MTRAAAFFDLDKTIIAKSSTLAFGRPFFQGGLINRRTVLKTAYAQFVFSLAGADAQQMERLRAQMTAMVTGWDAATVHEIVRETLHEIVDPLVYAEAADLIEEHRAAGREIVIVSSSGAEMVEPIGEMLGADRVVATRMVVEDGRYTGEIDFYAYAENKAAAMREVAAEGGYDLADCYAYSDSVTDLPMLAAVGHPHGRQPRPRPAQGRAAARLAGAAVRAAGEHARAVLDHRDARGHRCGGDGRRRGRRRSGLVRPSPDRARGPAGLGRPAERPPSPPGGLTPHAPALPRERAPGEAPAAPRGPSAILRTCSPRSSPGSRPSPCAWPRHSSAGPCAPHPAGGAAGPRPASACSSRCPARGCRCWPPSATERSPAPGCPPRPAGAIAVTVVALTGLLLAPG